MIVRRLLTYLSGRLPEKVISGPNGEPYLHRWFLGYLPWLEVEVYLHKFVGSDPDRGFHNHPWTWSFALILAGRYLEYYHEGFGADGVRLRAKERKAPGFNWIGRHKWHRVLIGREAWTLFVHGKRVRRWGFMRPVINQQDDKGATWSVDLELGEKTSSKWWRKI